MMDTAGDTSGSSLCGIYHSIRWTAIPGDPLSGVPAAQACEHHSELKFAQCGSYAAEQRAAQQELL